MATAVQARRPQTVAEEKVSGVLHINNPNEDSDRRLLLLLEVCREEQTARDKKGKEDQWCFWVATTARARWAIEQCPRISPGKYPKSRKSLALDIADGFLATEETDAESVFALTLLCWPEEDEKIPADALREMMEFRWNGTSASQEEKTQKIKMLVNYAAGAGKGMNEDVIRTVFKAAGVWLDMRGLLLLLQKISVMM